MTMVNFSVVYCSSIILRILSWNNISMLASVPAIIRLIINSWLIIYKDNVGKLHPTDGIMTWVSTDIFYHETYGSYQTRASHETETDQCKSDLKEFSNKLTYFESFHSKNSSQRQLIFLQIMNQKHWKRCVNY